MTDLDQKLHNDAPSTHPELVQENAHLKAENQFLKEQLGLAKHRLFAPKSEKSPTGQEAMLFPFKLRRDAIQAVHFCRVLAHVLTPIQYLAPQTVTSRPGHWTVASCVFGLPQGERRAPQLFRPSRVCKPKRVEMPSCHFSVSVLPPRPYTW